VKAWRYHQHGEPADVLAIEDVDEPRPEPDQVLVRVAACALNFPEVLQIRGDYQVTAPLPHTPGSEIAGTDVATERRVSCVNMGGGLAAMAAVTAEHCLPVPASMTDAQAAALPINYLTTYHALADRAQLRPDETVLVHAAAGGVGSAAVQIAHALGAGVVATAGGPEKTALVRDRLGAEHVIDYRAEELREAVLSATDGRGVDVVYDPVGGDVFDASRRLVAFGGRYLVIGFAGGRIPAVPANHVLLKGYSVVGVHWGLAARLDPSLRHRGWDALLKLFEQGAIDPLVMEEVPFEGAAGALTDIAARRTWGKVVVRPPANG
jgi:NADPH2:quinone reductase